jgi:hypothetical protein
MWNVEVKRFYLETNKVNKKGKPVIIPITHRKLYVKIDSVVDSGDYRICLKKEKYTISIIPRIPQSCWTNPNGKIEIWYKIPSDKVWVYDDGTTTIERPYKRTNDKPMTEKEILFWLKSKIGNEAIIALQTLQTQEPEFEMA